jgi:serine/threonine-protein kinase
LNADRWQRIEAVFHEVSEAAREDRGPLLEERCGADAELRGHVLSLLAAGDATQSPIRSAVHGVARDLSDTGRWAVGRRVGPYELKASLGSGGMGTVYRALRCDDEFQKEVAIKVARFGLDHPDFVPRFRSERQILARLEHPNIARLLDGGTTEGGIPYVVIELVEGEPLTAFCRGISINDRLRLFLKICDAVEYAHQNLIVHRDLKPANILVTAEGEPKLLDFGIAKLLEPDGMPVEQTRTQRMMLTPEYASPEQFRGEMVRTVSDVYSLGVLLYEVLAGRHPFREPGESPLDLSRKNCEVDPLPPSRTAGLARAEQKQLAGDLDQIVLKAMRKEPDRRYASVAQFSNDIRNSLEGYPVQARKDSFSYRAGKFLRRNWLAAGLAATLAVSLIGFGVAMAVLAKQLAGERDVAKRQQRLAERQTAFLVDLFREADPEQARGATLTARQLLDRGAERVGKELAGDPQAQATLTEAIGTVYTSLGEYDRSAQLLEQSLEMRKREFGERSLETASSLSQLGQLEYARGNYDRALSLQQTVLAVRRELLGSEHVDVAGALLELAVTHEALGESKTAEQHYREALAMHTRLLGERHADTASNMAGLAAVLRHKGDFKGAEPLYRKALEVRRELFGSPHPEVAHSLNHLARLYIQTGEPARAEPLAREGLEMRRKLFGEHHPETVASQSNLAGILLSGGNIAEGERLYRRSLASLRQQVGPDHPYVAAAVYSVARAVVARKAFAEAIPIYRESLALHEKVLSPDHPDMARPMVGLASALLETGSPKEAQHLLTRALAIQEKHFGPDGAQVRTTRGLLEEARRALGQIHP